MVFCPVPTVIFYQVSLSLLHPKNKTKPKKEEEDQGKQQKEEEEESKIKAI